MPVFRERITSRPLGRLYFVAVTRGTLAVPAGRAAACAAGALWATILPSPAVVRRMARKRARRFCIGHLRRAGFPRPVLQGTPAGPQRGTRPTVQYRRVRGA